MNNVDFVSPRCQFHISNFSMFTPLGSRQIRLSTSFSNGKSACVVGSRGLGVGPDHSAPGLFVFVVLTAGFFTDKSDGE
jgi:hypothetical protein